jgi:Fe2+ transport system protein FeoA
MSARKAGRIREGRTLRHGLSFAPSPTIVAPDSDTPILLTSLEAGSFARLHDSRLDDDTRSLLRSLGLTDACRLRVCQSGDPFVVQVRATRIGMSHAVADRLRVVRDHSTDPSHAAHARRRA